MGDDGWPDLFVDEAKVGVVRPMTSEEKTIAAATAGKVMRKAVVRMVCSLFLLLLGSVLVGLISCSAGSLLGFIVGVVCTLFALRATLDTLAEARRRCDGLSADVAEGTVRVLRGSAREDKVWAEGGRYWYYVPIPDALPAPGTPVECVVGPHSGLILGVRATTQNGTAQP